MSKRLKLLTYLKNSQVIVSVTYFHTAHISIGCQNFIFYFLIGISKLLFNIFKTVVILKTSIIVSQ